MVSDGEGRVEEADVDAGGAMTLSFGYVSAWLAV